MDKAVMAIGTSTSKYGLELRLYTTKDLKFQELSKPKCIDNVEEFYDKLDELKQGSFSIMSIPRKSWGTRSLFNYLYGIDSLANWTGLTDRYGRMVCYNRKRIYMDLEERFNKFICFDHNNFCLPAPQISTNINLSEVIHSFYLEYINPCEYYDDIHMLDYYEYFPISLFYPRINLYDIEWYCSFMKYHDNEAILSGCFIDDAFARYLDKLELSHIERMTIDFVSHYSKIICNKIIPYRDDEHKNKPDKNVHKSFKKRK